MEVPSRLNNTTDKIYFIGNDEALAKDLLEDKKLAEYDISRFFSFEELETAVVKEVPAVIIMDTVFKNSVFADAEVFHRLKARTGFCPPVIIISKSNGLEARLAAARAGAIRYLCKPLEKKKLLKTLKGLMENPGEEAHKVLLVESDESLQKHYAIAFRKANMIVETLSKSLDVLSVLNRFKPDIIVLVDDMPECSGNELAHVIRQDISWVKIPIIHLYSRTNFEPQAMEIILSGDTFLAKPIEANYLIEAVNARANRSRKVNQLNDDLEAALRESKYKTITMDQHDVVSITDASGKIIYANDKFCETSGFCRDELLGENHRIVKSGHHDDNFYQEMWKTITQGKVWHGTLCNRNKNGELFWMESTIVPFLDDNGRPYQYVSARTEITKTKLAEIALRKSESRLNFMLSSSPITLYTCNATSPYGATYVSENIAQHMGYKPEDFTGNSDFWAKNIHPDDRQQVLDNLPKLFEHGKHQHEYRFRMNDGSYCWVYDDLRLIRDAAGKPLEIVGYWADISERKAFEQDLKISNERLVRGQVFANIGTWDLNIQTGGLIWSERIGPLFGYPEGELETSYDNFLAAIHPDDRQGVIDAVNASIEDNKQYNIEHRVIWPDDTVHWLQERGRVIRNKEGEALRMLGVVQDISERKDAEIAMVSAQVVALNANKAKTKFLSSMSHELRTPMNAIMGFGQLLNMETDSPLNDSQQENVNEISKASNHLLALINEVLDLAKIESGQIDVSLEVVVLNEILAETLKLIIPLAQKRGIAIRLSQEGDEISLEQILRHTMVVRADSTRLKQALLNLLSNAVKYNCENGEIIIACDYVDNNMIHISITDTGVGLTENQKTHLFEAFNRLGADQTEVEGTGIGLVITKKIIGLMNGKIGVVSQPDKGSTFWIELPSESLPIEIEKKDKKIAIQEVSESGRSVLYIEDNPANLRLVTQLLGRWSDMRVWSAHEPLLGLELAVAHKPDLVLLDINLPGMDGFEVLNFLRENKATRNTPVIAISANAMPQDIEKGMAAGFDDYITKPINVPAFMQAVDDVLLEKSKIANANVNSNAV